MYKITIRQIVGDLTKETIIETDDLEFAKNILVSEEIVKVETDVANESIDLGMTKTELADLALRKLSEAFLPHYEKDEGPLSPTQIQIMRDLSTVSDISEERFTKSLL